MTSVIIGVVLMLLVPSADSQMPFENADWSAPQAEVAQPVEPAGTQDFLQEEKVSAEQDSEPVEDSDPVNDGFLLIQGGAFLMGSPETENWRIDDEIQHEAAVDSFFMDPYETTQGEYVSLMAENPSAFTGDDLPGGNNNTVQYRKIPECCRSQFLWPLSL